METRAPNILAGETVGSRATRIKFVLLSCCAPRRSRLLGLVCGSPLRLTVRNDSESLAERFSRRTAPFSGSDQVSAVVKLSLFGRKNSKMSPRRQHIPLLVY